MFEKLSLKQIIMIFGGLLLIVLITQIYLFLTVNSTTIHFVFSFLALFIALLLFHSVNIKLKRIKRKKK